MSGIVAQNLNKQSGLIKAPEGGGAWTFISKVTASADSTVSFTSGIDSTYTQYIFYFVNIHPEEASKFLTFQGSTDGGSSYGVTLTSSFFRAQVQEDGSNSGLAYDTSMDLANSTSFNNMGRPILDDADACLSGSLRIFDPSSTTFIKHFMYRVSVMGNYLQDGYGAGYFNTTSAVDAMQFKMSSGNIDAGSIFLHGLSTS